MVFQQAAIPRQPLHLKKPLVRLSTATMNMTHLRSHRELYERTVALAPTIAAFSSGPVKSHCLRLVNMERQNSPIHTDTLDTLPPASSRYPHP